MAVDQLANEKMLKLFIIKRHGTPKEILNKREIKQKRKRLFLYLS